MGVKLRERKLKGKTGYYLDISYNGNRWYEFTKIYIHNNDPDKKEKKDLLKQIRAKKEIELGATEHGYTPKFKKSLDFLAYYQNYLDNYKKKDVRMIHCSLAKFKDFIKSDHLPISKVDSSMCDKFKDYLKYETNLKGETPQNYFARFKKVVRQAYRDKLIKDNITEDIRFPKGPSKLKKEVLTKEELIALVNTPCTNENIKNAFLFSCMTGLGVAEIRNLTWDKINNGKIKLYREKTESEIWNDLPASALKILSKIERKGEFVFELPTDTSIAKDIKYWVKKANIEKRITFYCGRHTFATQLLLNGANLKTVADLVGHSTTKHTVKYLNYVDSLKTDAVKALPDIFE